MVLETQRRAGLKEMVGSPARTPETRPDEHHDPQQEVGLMTTVRPPDSSQETPVGADSDQKLPLRWLMIGTVAALAAATVYATAGLSAAILLAAGVAAALHKILE
ncbi:hypothetical protein [Saccharopolyspora mangrovi]|uniref:Uncharacterized protein n=1 Tax=Saccharopolyspora mangrovi TaxID=3082379 RepID=A0ABU6AIY7_9PSEU|nr:hypothetical protein [Saccharopolyspora sp. S2-29]MEB3371280.1 hypothetical protein [Saccharopolyspora sp. S2-29]